jgi:hypothetical protein
MGLGQSGFRALTGTGIATGDTSTTITATGTAGNHTERGCGPSLARRQGMAWYGRNGQEAQPAQAYSSSRSSPDYAFLCQETPAIPTFFASFSLVLMSRGFRDDVRRKSSGHRVDPMAGGKMEHFRESQPCFCSYQESTATSHALTDVTLLVFMAGSSYRRVGREQKK